MYPDDLRYSKDHEWVRVQGDRATVGITDYAQKQLGDVVFVELPAPGRALALHEVFGTVESVKAVSELYAPVSGTVTAINEELATAPRRPGTASAARRLWRPRPSEEPAESPAGPSAPRPPRMRHPEF